jgi:hypothetical protein
LQVLSARLGGGGPQAIFLSLQNKQASRGFFAVFALLLGVVLPVGSLLVVVGGGSIVMDGVVVGGESG